VTEAALSRSRAEALASRLDLELDCGVCFACLGIVSLALEHGDEADVRSELRRMTPVLWEDGLAGPALAAVQRARNSGETDASAALAELERRGGRCAVARAIVRRLAEELARRSRLLRRVETIARRRPMSLPELN